MGIVPKLGISGSEIVIKRMEKVDYMFIRERN